MFSFLLKLALLKLQKWLLTQWILLIKPFQRQKLHHVTGFQVLLDFLLKVFLNKLKKRQPRPRSYKGVLRPFWQWFLKLIQHLLRHFGAILGVLHFPFNSDVLLNYFVLKKLLTQQFVLVKKSRMTRLTILAQNTTTLNTRYKSLSVHVKRTIHHVQNWWSTICLRKIFK